MLFFRIVFIAGIFFIITTNAFSKEEKCNKEQYDRTSSKQNYLKKNKSEKKENTVIAIVDLKQIASESKAGQSIEKQIMEINNDSKEDLIKLENKIKSLDTGNNAESEISKIENLRIAMYDMVRSKRYAISETYRLAILDLEKKIKDIISQIAEQRSIDLIITDDAIIYSNKNILNLNKNIVEIIDKKYPYIKVKLKI